MRKFLFTSFAVLLFSWAFGQPGEDWKLKVAPSLLEVSRSEQDIPFLVLLPQQADLSLARQLRSKDEKATFVYQQLTETARTTQGDLLDFLKARQVVHQRLSIINAIRVEGSIDLIRSLAMRSDVARILDNPALRYTEPVDWAKQADPDRTAITWGIDRIQADKVWALGYRGQQVTIGGQDTGYEWDHPALKQQYRGYDAETDSVDHNYHWHDAIHEISPLSADSINPCGLDSPVPCDDNSHGTHTMGTMIGLDGENEIGVAPEAQWCACRNMERGWGSPFTYLECFEWFLAPTDLNGENPNPLLAPHVINNSWGCPAFEGCDSTNWEIMDMAVNHLRMAGTVVVVSAGNSGSTCGSISVPPAMYEGGFAVGATAINDTIAGFSSRGPVTADGSNRLKPDIAAPGVGVRSARPGGEYGNASGTSMAGPHVAGVVALMISANPELAGQVDLIEDILRQSAVPKTTDQQCGDIPGSEVPNHTYGYGRLDALGAVLAAVDLIPVHTDNLHTSQAILVYPNPVKDQLYIDARMMVGVSDAVLYDIHGRRVALFQWQANQPSIESIDVSKLASGLYFINIQSDNGWVHGKFMKE